MKRNLKILICLILFSAFSLASKANSIPKDSLPDLQITGRISKKSKLSGTYKVELLYKNILIDSKEVKDENPFSFIMPSNRDYLIKISKKGYTTKLIGINTGLHKYEYAEKSFKYEFVTEMEETFQSASHAALMH